MLAAGLGLAAAGGILLLLTLNRARTDEDVARSKVIEEQERRERSVLANKSSQREWAYRAVYAHPVLMRLPGATLLGCGLVVLFRR